jgi:Domain of unknown function (DUF4386)
MTMTPTKAGSPPEVVQPGLKRTARITGLLYLGLALTGVLGSVVVRAQFFVADNPDATLSNLVAHEWLARGGIALELGIVLTQALTTLWFYRLFRSVDTFAAGAIAAFGVVNAVAIMGSAALLATAHDVANDASLASAGDRAAAVQLMYVASGHLWAVGGMFFGLWLIPMGWLVIRSRWLPRLLGWTLIVGGVGYLLSAFLGYLSPDADLVTQLLIVPSMIGELWILSYLVIVGLRQAPATTS